jgi:RNA polymerase sigma-70 factor (ECF subfamily)
MALTNSSAAAVRAAVAALPPEQRMAVEMAYFAGLAYPEIAARTGVPLGTVKSRLRLALERLRRQLTGEYAALGA